ncbi:hypothetical protein V1498_12970 [Peribacillus sp. SCS-26]|uniref:hypothetical protein n=1 Tax=Paraperibacillus marinus TaxID=3115295 RepID=UPI0039065863
MARRVGKVKNVNNRSLFLRGILLGGIAGTLLTLFDSRTRKQTVDMLAQVKENPVEVKDQMTEKLTEAAMKVQHALEETQDAYNNASSRRFQ